MFTKGKIFAAVAATFALNTSIVFAGTTDAAATSATFTSNHPMAIHSANGVQPADQAKSTTNATVHRVAKHESSNPVYMTVQQGQSLWSISRRYGVSVSSLERWNNLTSKSVLHVGQRLIVAHGSNQASKSASSPSSREASVDLAVAAAAQGLDVVYYAKKYLGAPYTWGGASPSGFDCSGFTMFVYRHFGLNLPHTSFGQFNHGTSVSKSQLRAGDLVFFSTAGGGASHVGIYVGQGKFINAAGNSIRYSSISDGYWASNYVGARRVLD